MLVEEFRGYSITVCGSNTKDSTCRGWCCQFLGTRHMACTHPYIYYDRFKTQHTHLCFYRGTLTCIYRTWEVLQEVHT